MCARALSFHFLCYQYMADLHRTELKVRAERAILIRVARNNRNNNGFDSLEELHSLADSAGAKVVGRLSQQRNHPDPTTYLGKGKIQELAALCKEKEADVVICDDDLSPAQVKKLESELDLKVVDRTELILDIFATHARTRQAKLQVELAQLEYAYPRLKRMWTHLDRTAGGTLGGPVGGGIGVRGPGEKQLEVDRRLVKKSINQLKERLEKIDERRRGMVQSRNERFDSVSLVGYTNAGKSSLLKALTGADVSIRDRLFETLDTRTREWQLPDGREIMLSDTVGFIRKLPHHLVASFRATLEEAREADLLLHVIDVSQEDVEGAVEAVNEVLQEIGCGDKPLIPVLNKVDLLDDESKLPPLRKEFPECVITSAANGRGLKALTARVSKFLDRLYEEMVIETGVGNGKLLSFLYESGAVLSRNYDHETVRLKVKIPDHLAGVVESMGGKLCARAGDTQD